MTTQNTTLENSIFTLGADRLPELQDRIAVLNRRAAKLGTPGLELEIVSRELLPRDNGRVFPIVKVRIGGQVPVVGGHSFVARIEHHDVGNIVTRAPSCSRELPTALRTAEPKCDHCQTKRARKDTFVLQRPDGSLVQIGRNCLADYLRTGDVETALRMWSLLGAVVGLLAGEDHEGGWGGGGYGHIGATTFLATVIQVIRISGWVSRSQARQAAEQCEEGVVPTSDHAMFAVGPCPMHPTAAAMWREFQPDTSAVEEAAAVVEWAQDLGERPELNDYLSNLRVACSLGYVTERNAGLVASAVMACRRETEANVQRTLRASTPGRHVGEIGKRLELSLTVLRVNYTEGQYGITTIVGMVDSEGNDYTWFASGTKQYKAGDVLVGKGTIKAHKSYQDRPQTILTRCAFEAAKKSA